MSRLSRSFATACAILSLNICLSARAESAAAQDNPVIQWNKTLLTIVRTPGAQPATVHPTRSFAVMHAAMYDAVNAIDGTHRPYTYHRMPPKTRRPHRRPMRCFSPYTRRIKRPSTRNSSNL
jgi:hypothetical protein